MFCFPAAALLLEFLPWGVRMDFANAEGAPFREFYSYFDLLPVGYADVFPILVACSTCILLLAVSFYSCRGSRGPLLTGLTAAVLGFAACIFQLLFSPLTLIGVFVTLLMGAEIAYLGFHLRTTKKTAAQKDEPPEDSDRSPE